ncbi:hypothetical protein [Jiella sonneratiae]|uniref:Methyl-accepting transducer domain-containing protein n=1 Tax=Jiella sonneratiae TaxID=2816856 RepID=A0ABS3IZJ5_9HYPH|nr:hypothetical protein [Jiella sonneratiae]MBO0902851.1 hypothetical protein [Jiella sonneratiae]
MSALALLPAASFDDDDHGTATAGGLAPHRRELDATIAQIERVFVGLGERLITCVGLLGEMQSAFGAITDAHASPELASAEAAIRALVGECDRLLDRLDQERGLIQRLTRTIATAAPQIGDLRRTVAMIAAIAINARVTAAGMRNQGTSELAVFTDDVLELSRRATSVVERLQEGQGRLHALLTDAAARSDGFGKTFRAATERLRERIEVDLRGAVDERERAAEVGASASAACRALTDEASAIVASLQIGDNTRQRLEHASAGLALADDEPAARPVILRLEMAQIEDTRDRLVEETGQGREAILALSRRIDRSFTTLRTDLAKAGGSDAPGAKRLATGVAQAAAELSRSEEEHRHVETLAEAIGADVERFGACAAEMRTLEFEMRLVSLNTAITCSKLGHEGKALGVVSLQMRELVGEMVTRAESVSTALCELGTVTAELTEARRTSAGRSLATLVADAEKSQAFLQSVDAQFRAAATVLEDLGGRISGLTSDAGAALGRLDGLVEELTAIEAALSVHAGAGGDAAAADDHRDLTDKLRAAYTMEIERVVHDAVLGAFDGEE